MAEIFLSYRRDDSTERDRTARRSRSRRTSATTASFATARSPPARTSSRRSGARSSRRPSCWWSSAARWLGARDAAGRRRLDDPGDFVRLEIELALAARVAVVPVLVEGAAMPSAADLPPSLARVLALPGGRALGHALALRRRPADRDAAGALRDRLRSRRRSSTGGRARRRRADATRERSSLDLAIHPKRLIARRQTGRASDYGARAGLPRRGASSSATSSCCVGIDLPGRARRIDRRSRRQLDGELAARRRVRRHHRRRPCSARSLALAWRIAGRRRRLSPASASSSPTCTAAPGSAFAPAALSSAPAVQLSRSGLRRPRRRGAAGACVALVDARRRQRRRGAQTSHGGLMRGAGGAC